MFTFYQANNGMSFYNTVNPSKRDRILHAALMLFFEKGYFNTSVHDIREKADVSIGLVYRYFKNKEEVAQTVYAELLQDMTEIIEGILESETSFRDRTRAIMTYYLGATETSPEMVDFVLFARHQEIMPGHTPICAAKPPELIRAMVINAMETNEIRQMHLAISAPSIFGPMIRIIQQRLMGLIKVPVDSLLDDIWESCWRSVKP
jgi:AcrR family transcriptional regulator